MLFTTLPQLIALTILFLGGLILGLGLHPGGKKWRRRFEDESANYAKFRRDADVKLRDANQRIADLEREHAEQGAQRSAVPPVVASAAAVPAFSSTGRSMDDNRASGADDLGKIRGIDPALKNSLFGLGVTRFADITEMSAVDEMALEQHLQLPAGYVAREQWRDQADLLRAGKDAEQAERFPPA